MGPKTKKRIIARLIEFFFVGLLMGIVEDLLAIHFATDAKITWEVVRIAFIVALPFAFISEILVDFKVFQRVLKKKKRQLFK